jgi:hypothetical protein
VNPRKADVVVVGGGTAGIAAAVAAARAGAKTLLVERHGALGGMASAALVHTLCGLYRLREDESRPLEFANEGFPQEFATRLLALGGARGPIRMGRLDVLLHSPLALAGLADQITDATRGLEVLLHSGVVAVDVCAQRINAVSVHCRGRKFDIEAGAVVDATGDAVVAALAGADFACAPADRLLRPAVIFSLGGVAQGALDGEARLHIAHAVCRAVSAGTLPPEALGIAFREGMLASEVWATLDLEAAPYDPLSPQCLSGLEKIGRRLAFAVLGFLRQAVAGFESAHLAAMPAQVGIRESRRITGHVTLTGEDVLVGRECANPAAFTSWPLELRETAKGPRLKFPEGNRPAGIAPGCLQSRSFANLFAAGRCLSCTHEAQASIRVIGTCLATGAAAGHAAAAKCP